MNNLGNKHIMAENLKFYISKKGISRGDLAADLDFPYTTVCDWLKGNTYPRIDKIEIMANYFGIDKSDLIEKREDRQDKKPYYLNPESAEIAQEMYERPELRTLFKTTRKVSPEDLKAVQALIDAMVDNKKTED